MLPMITAFLGKGGVGKTSVASAYALYCSRKGRTLIVSSDFMPSLKHIFSEKKRNLDVLELSEKEVSEKWKSRYGDQVEAVLKEFVDVEDWILDHIASSPGVAEEFMIANIVELEESGNYDYVIWDTAASSATMHLLLLEREFYEHLDRDVRIFLRLKNRFRISKTFEILEEWKNLANRVWSRIEEARFHMVTTMDDLSLIQTAEIERDITGMGLNIDATVFNRCTVEPIKRANRSIVIPELQGSALEIVEKMTGYMGPIFDNTKTVRETQRYLTQYGP